MANSGIKHAFIYEKKTLIEFFLGCRFQEKYSKSSNLTDT